MHNVHAGRCRLCIHEFSCVFGGGLQILYLHLSKSMNSETKNGEGHTYIRNNSTNACLNYFWLNPYNSISSTYFTVISNVNNSSTYLNSLSVLMKISGHIEHSSPCIIIGVHA